MRRLLRHLRARPHGVDWGDWPDEAYGSEPYRQRLRAVQLHLAECIDHVDTGLVEIVSVCAGDGRDVIGVVREHPRRDDVRATLVELNERCVASARRRCAQAGLERQITVIHGDATDYATYVGRVPCDIVVLCGVWGHFPSGHRERLVRAMTTLLRPGGQLVWTRGEGQGIARLSEIQEHFVKPDWHRGRLSITPDENFAVVTQVFSGTVQEPAAAGRMFEFRANTG